MLPPQRLGGVITCSIIVIGNRIDAPPAIIKCETDQEAVANGRAMIDGHDVEVWQGARYVMRIEAASP